MTVRSIRIATRSSRLALWQAEHVRGLLNAVAPDVPVEIIHVSTLGDRDLSAPLSSLGAFGVFTREVQRVVLDGKADLAVHSLKDLPPDLQLLEIRGNVETRLRKLDAGEFDAIVLAVAGLERLGLAGRITQPLPPPVMFPAVGQGALGLECRADDNWLRDILVRISDPATFAAVIAERALLAELRAGCHAPLGVATSLNGDQLTLDAVVLSPDGVSRIHASLSRPVTAPAELGRTVAGLLREQGADALIAAAKQSPP
jgi:hydroxymethylbilane synthase